MSKLCSICNDETYYAYIDDNCKIYKFDMCNECNYFYKYIYRDCMFKQSECRV